jgi:hypothetical protein
MDFMKGSYMKRNIILFISVMLVFALTACSSSVSATDVVEKGITAIKDLDIVQIQKYFNTNDITDESDILGDDFEVENMEIFALMTKNLSYEIIEEKIDGDTATVKAKITNINMTIIMGEYITQALALAFSQIGQTDVDEAEMEKQMEELLVDLLSKDDIAMLTTEVDIKLNKIDKDWKIDLNDELINALFGGIMTFANEFQD